MFFNVLHSLRNKTIIIVRCDKDTTRCVPCAKKLTDIHRNLPNETIKKQKLTGEMCTRIDMQTHAGRIPAHTHSKG